MRGQRQVVSNTQASTGTDHGSDGVNQQQLDSEFSHHGRGARQCEQFLLKETNQGEPQKNRFPQLSQRQENRTSRTIAHPTAARVEMTKDRLSTLTTTQQQRATYSTRARVRNRLQCANRSIYHHQLEPGSGVMPGRYGLGGADGCGRSKSNAS